MIFCCLLIFFFKINFFKIFSFSNTIKGSNSLDPDQAQHFVGPDLDPNCLQWLSAGKDLNNTNLWFKSKANAIGFSTSYKIVFLFFVLTSTNSTVCQLYTVPSRLGPEWPTLVKYSLPLFQSNAIPIKKQDRLVKKISPQIIKITVKL